MSKFKYMTIDCETTGLSWLDDKLHGIGVGYAEGEAEYYPAWNIPDQVKKDLANPSIAKIGHNLHAFDAKVIRRFGLEINGPLDDVMILADLLSENEELGLKYLAKKYIGEESLERKQFLDKYMSSAGAGHVGELCAKDLTDPSRPHFDVIADYCKEDVNNTTTLFFKFVDRLKKMDELLKGPKFGFKKSPWDYYKEEARPLEYVLFEMEYRGVKVDLDALNKIKQNSLERMATIEEILTKALRNRIPKVEQELYEKEIAKLSTPEAKAKRAPGQGKSRFKWSNSNHVAALLYKYCDLPEGTFKKTGKGKYSTDKEAIEMLIIKLPEGHPLIKLLKLYAEYKVNAKLASTYTGDSDKGILSHVKYVNGEARIFPSYRQTTGTGRLACSNPNMQNLKRDSEVKRFFIPDSPDEVFDDADYSQIELRTGAHLSRDEALLEAYNTGQDVHLRTASRLFARKITKEDDVERQAGKRTNFLTIFDGGPGRLMVCLKQDTGKDFTFRQCKEFIKIWFEEYKDVRTYLDSQLEFFKKYKFCISETGRIRRIPDIVYGKHLKWERGPDFKWKPFYRGPAARIIALKREIVKSDHSIRPENITDEMVGRLAYKKYSHAIKAGYNQPIQGLAASMTKRSMIALHRAGRIIANQVHDSLSVPRKHWDLEAKKQLIDIMKSTYKLSLPVEVDVKTLKSFHPRDKHEG